MRGICWLQKWRRRGEGSKVGAQKLRMVLAGCLCSPSSIARRLRTPTDLQSLGDSMQAQRSEATALLQQASAHSLIEAEPLQMRLNSMHIRLRQGTRRCKTKSMICKLPSTSCPKRHLQSLNSITREERIPPKPEASREREVLEADRQRLQAWVPGSFFNFDMICLACFGRFEEMLVKEAQQAKELRSSNTSAQLVSGSFLKWRKPPWSVFVLHATESGRAMPGQVHRISGEYVAELLQQLHSDTT